MVNDQELAEWLRYALKNLYDRGRLRDSPLLEVLGMREHPQPSVHLRRYLIGSIKALEPDTRTPPDSPLWRAYETLLYRYVQQLSQLEVAQQLGLSVRQVRREQKRAIEDLASRIMQQNAQEMQAVDQQLPAEESPTVSDELSWLNERRSTDQVSFGDGLQTVMTLLQPLARQHNVDVQIVECPQPCSVAIHPVALKQALLSLITVGLYEAEEGKVEISAFYEGDTLAVTIAAMRASPLSVLSPKDADCIRMAERLVVPHGGEVSVDDNSTEFRVVLRLATPGEVPVLLIDDNRDTWRLFERYLIHTPYRLYPMEDVDTALETASNIHPIVIVLDVVMPSRDGWEILGDLSQHPLTSEIPIIVCTILAQEELAYSLGAAAFLQKPVSRNELLVALGRVVDQVKSAPQPEPVDNQETRSG